LLPAGCFVWRDEFEAAFRKAYSPMRRAILDLQRGDRGERAGERELNFAPLIQDSIAVMEGFAGMVRFDPNSEVEQQAYFYGFDEAAELAGITAMRAAELLNIREGELLRRYGVPSVEQIEPLAQRLLTLDELRGTGIDGTIHPLSEWLSRAKAKDIRYLEGLDWAVGVGRTQKAEQDSGKGCQVFRDMEKLTADELSITFVGDTSESGLGANNILEVSARGATRRVAVAEFDLMNRRGGSLNSQGAVLLGMAQKKWLTYTVPNATKIARLRKVLREHIGVNGDPFEKYKKGVGWVPRFKIVDKRGAADERAKREGERLTDSIEQMNERGRQLADAGPAAYPFEPENDSAGEWLKDKDQQG
jgi:hypothetical protein